jgi:hypothetical protein
MFDPITLAALSAIPAVAQGVTGLVQSQRSKNILKNLERPTYAIPEAQTQALNRSKNLASSMQMAGQSNVAQKIDQASANALYDINQNSSSGVEALAALSGVYVNQMAQENQLGLNAAQDYERRQAMVGNELNKYAGYQDKAWDYNVNQPFQEKAAAAQALGEAGMRNKYEGMKGVVGAGVMGMKMQNANEDNAAWLKAFKDSQSSLPADALTQNYSTNTPKSLEEFGKSLEGATSLSKLLNPNITGYNQYGQPQFDNSLGKPFGVLENKAMNTPQLTPNVIEQPNVTKIAQKEASLLPQKPLTAEMIAKAPEILSVVGKKDSPVISPIQSKSNVNGLGNSSKQPLDAIKYSPSLQKFAEQNTVPNDEAIKEKTMTYIGEQMVGSTAQGNKRLESFTKEVSLPVTNGAIDWRAAVDNYHNSEECREGKCFSSTSAHGPGYFAIPMIGDLIDQRGKYYDIDDLNKRRGTNLSPKDQKSAIEFLFKDDLSKVEINWLEQATTPNGSLQGVRDQMKPKLKALKEEYPDLYADIVDDEGNYIGGNK